MKGKSLIWKNEVLCPFCSLSCAQGEFCFLCFPFLYQHRVMGGAEQPGRVRCPKSTTCFPFVITGLLLVLIAFCYRLWSDPKEPRRGRLQEQRWTVASMLVSLTWRVKNLALTICSVSLFSVLMLQFRQPGRPWLASAPPTLTLLSFVPCTPSLLFTKDLVYSLRDSLTALFPFLLGL